jgi:hypothetical protein
MNRKAYLVLDEYPYYLKPNTLYEITGQCQIEPNIYFVSIDGRSKTFADVSQIRFLDDVRNDNINELLK